MELLLTAALLFVIFLGVCKIIKLAKKATITILVIVMVAYLAVIVLSLDIGELWLEFNHWITNTCESVMSYIKTGG